MVNILYVYTVYTEYKSKKKKKLVYMIRNRAVKRREF